MTRTIGIAGLGLIGGSLAKAIKARTGCRVLGFDACGEVTAAAKAQGAIDGELTDASVAECDIAAAALYPELTVSYFDRIFPLMRAKSIAVDCAGVKSGICAKLSEKAKLSSIRFVGGHPMAGVERSGFWSSFAELFDGATMILCKEPGTDLCALEELRALFLSLGFGKIKITTAREHDEIIAYTSQLAHIVSSAYIQSDTAKKRYGFSAGSFKDLTRVAKLNADMWTALFFENRENLLRETDSFLERLRRYREALAGCDPGAMKELLEKGCALKLADEEEEGKWLAK